jgi:N-acetylmuramoyl-L-alanine amidase
MKTADSALKALCDPAREVSAHYLISRTGTVYQLVEEDKRAWHAGAGEWAGITDVNSHSIGIELDNTGFEPFSEPLMCALEDLLEDVMDRHAIPPHRVIGHSDMAPGRKIDPGPRFDWRRLALKNLSVWPEDVGRGDRYDRRFIAPLCDFGYPDHVTLEAFRARFRPWAKGDMDMTDVLLAMDLAHRFGVDQWKPTA